MKSEIKLIISMNLISNNNIWRANLVDFKYLKLLHSSLKINLVKKTVMISHHLFIIKYKAILNLKNLLWKLKNLIYILWNKASKISLLQMKWKLANKIKNYKRLNSMVNLTIAKIWKVKNYNKKKTKRNKCNMKKSLWMIKIMTKLKILIKEIKIVKHTRWQRNK
jgi:hypothetical protein